MSDPESYARILKADVFALGANADEVVKNVRTMLTYKNVILFYSVYPNYVRNVQKKNKNWWRRIFGAKKPLEIVPWMNELENTYEGMFSHSEFYKMSFNCDRSDFIHKLFNLADLTTDYVLLCDSDVDKMTYVKDILNSRYKEQVVDVLKNETPSFLDDMLKCIEKNISWRSRGG